jgi:hypothetical protein
VVDPYTDRRLARSGRRELPLNHWSAVAGNRQNEALSPIAGRCAAPDPVCVTSRKGAQMLVELMLDFMPWPRSRRVERLGERVNEHLDRGSILPSGPDAIKRELNERGWLHEEVIAAGELRQGKEPTVVGMITGLALIELLRPRRSKSLPRQFVLAVTADRVVAFKARGGAEGENSEGPYRLLIKPGERASWRNGSVRLAARPEDPKTTIGTLVLDEVERIPVYRPNPDADPSTDELVALLGGSRPASA